MITPKNWSEFQHYKDRSPPWIKLHRGLLDNFEFHQLPDASKALAPLLWLLASEYTDGKITLSIDALAFRFRTTEQKLRDALKPLIEAGFFTSDSTALAACKQDACLETEGETQEKTEAETLSEKISDPKPSKGNSRKKNEYPDEFQSFWKDYPTDPLQSKKQAHEAWRRLSPDDRELAARAAPAFRRYCESNPDYRPVHACRFIAQRRFDGFATPSAANGPPAGLSPQERAEWVRKQLEAENEANAA